MRSSNKPAVRLVSFAAALILGGCSHPVETSKATVSSPDPFDWSKRTSVNHREVERPAPITEREKMDQFTRLKLLASPLTPSGSPGQPGASMNLTIAAGYQSLGNGTEAGLGLIEPDAVALGGHFAFAEFNAFLMRADLGSGWVGIGTTGSPDHSTLIDCSVNTLSQPISFQFERFDGDSQWIDKSIVTASGGHVFYGLPPSPWRQGIPQWNSIRLLPVPETPRNTTWQFFGCELTIAP
jgi:hypothetical protein